MPIFDNKSHDFFFETKLSQEEIANTICSLTEKRLPKFLGIQPENVQVLAPMKSGISGITNLNAKLQETLNPPSLSKPEIVYGNTIFRTGDKIIQTTNNYNMEYLQYIKNAPAKEGKGVFNGDMGKISAIDKQTGEITVIFETLSTLLIPSIHPAAATPLPIITYFFISITSPHK